MFNKTKDVQYKVFFVTGSHSKVVAKSECIFVNKYVHYKLNKKINCHYLLR